MMIGLVSSSCGTQLAAVTPSNSEAAEPSSTLASPATVCPVPPPDVLASLMSGSITEKDNGKTLVLHKTDRFSVFLDDRLHPLAGLQADPTERLGLVSNGSLRGPNCYPIMFEAVSEGQAVLREGSFELHVLVDDSAPVTTIPLP